MSGPLPQEEADESYTYPFAIDDDPVMLHKQDMEFDHNFQVQSSQDGDIIPHDMTDPNFRDC